jgi:uncharacterized protein with FMN-binding domain
MAKDRMHPGLVALSATAITAIYVAGYMRTQAADASIAAAASAASSPTALVAPAAPPVASSSARTVVPTPLQPLLPRGGGAGPGGSPARRGVPPTAPTPPPQAAAAPSAAQSGPSYKDGTYTGQGSSRRGDVWVSITVAGSHITDVTITRSTLQYPLRDIAGLPSEVVQRQSAQVDTVSRATYSSQAFRSAVSQALSKAVQG